MKTSPDVFVVTDDETPEKIPPNVIVGSWKILENRIPSGIVYVRFKSYIGLKRSGKTPWAVIRKETNAHAVLEYYPSLERAVKHALVLNRF